jgi:signal transduction histidine kinase
VQVFLNLARNSQRAMLSSETRQLRITAAEENGRVVIRFEDTGTGIATPEKLFQPFQRGAKASGLGLYISRAIMRSFGGDIAHEPKAAGCCFAVHVPLVAVAKEALGA